MLGYTGESSVQAASFNWKRGAAAAAFVGASSAKSKSVIARCALHQWSRYADLSLSIAAHRDISATEASPSKKRQNTQAPSARRVPCSP